MTGRVPAVEMTSCLLHFFGDVAKGFSMQSEMSS